MDKLTRQFFDDAKRMTLSSQEKAMLWQGLSTFCSAKQMALSSREKEQSFAAIAAHMRRNPMPMSRTSSFSLWIHFHKLAASFAIALIIISAGGGTATYAAQAALPGDTLYPLKVSVTEPIIDKVVSIDPQWAAEWERRRIKRRLKEVEHLTERDALTEDQSALLEQRVEERMNRLQEHLSDLPEEERGRVQAMVDDVMARHEEFIENVAIRMPVPLPVIRVHRENVRLLRDEAHRRWEFKEEEFANPDPSVQSETEGWLSGRKRTTRNRVDPQGSRGFESPSLRQPLHLPPPPDRPSGILKETHATGNIPIAPAASLLPLPPKRGSDNFFDEQHSDRRRGKLEKVRPMRDRGDHQGRGEE